MSVNNKRKLCVLTENVWDAFACGNMPIYLVCDRFGYVLGCLVRFSTPGIGVNDQKTQLKVIYFGELDLFFGSFPQRKQSLPALISTLKLLCLAYDRVLIQSSALFEHSLALPALEALAPLVRAGRLGTSADHHAPSPTKYFKKRIERHLDRHHPSMQYARWREDELERLSERWQAILPEDWPLRRSVQNQIGGVQNQIMAHLEQAHGGAYERASRQMQTRLFELLDKGKELTRMPLLSAVASMRGVSSPADIAYAAMLVQGAYFLAGSSSHQTQNTSCHIYPGAIQQQMRKPFWEQAKVDLNMPFAQGFSIHDPLLKELACLPAKDCAQLCEHEDWEYVARILRGETSNPLHRERFKNLLGGKDIRDLIGAIPTLDYEAGRLAETACLPTWAGLVQATLGSTSLEMQVGVNSSTGANWCAFDWISRTLSGTCLDEVELQTAEVVLSPRQAHLFTLLAVAGESGVEEAQAKQMLLELDVGFAGEPVSLSSEITQKAKRTVLDVAKSTLNSIISDFGLAVYERKGRIYIEPPRITMHHTPWCYEPCHSSAHAPDLPPVLSKMWTLLYRYYPLEVSADVLAEGFERDGEQRSKYISRTIYRLRTCLEENETQWRVASDYLGNHRLVYLDDKDNNLNR